MNNIEALLHEAKERNASNYREVKNNLPKRLQRIQQKLIRKQLSENSQFLQTEVNSNTKNSIQDCEESIIFEINSLNSIESSSSVIQRQDSNNNDSNNISVISINSVKSVRSIKELWKQNSCFSSQQQSQPQQQQQKKLNPKVIQPLSSHSTPSSSPSTLQFLSGFSVIFFIRSFNLSSKRVDIFSKQLTTYGATVYLSLQEYYDRNKSLYPLLSHSEMEQSKENNSKVEDTKEIALLVASEDIKLPAAERMLGAFGDKLQGVLRIVVSIDFIVACLKERKRLPLDSKYYMYRQTMEAADQLKSLEDQVKACKSKINENNNPKIMEDNQEEGKQQERRQIMDPDFTKPTYPQMGQEFQQRKQLEEPQNRYQQQLQEVIIIDSQENEEEYKQQNINPENVERQQEAQNRDGVLFEEQRRDKSEGKQENSYSEKGQESQHQKLLKCQCIHGDNANGGEEQEGNKTTEEEQKEGELSNEVETHQGKDNSSIEPPIDIKQSLQLNTIMDMKKRKCSWSFEEETDKKQDYNLDEQQNQHQFNESCLDSEEDNSDSDYDERFITELPKNQKKPEDEQNITEDKEGFKDNQGEEGQDGNCEEDDDCQILESNQILTDIFDKARHKGIKRRDIQDSSAENNLDRNISTLQDQGQHFQKQFFSQKQIKQEQKPPAEKSLVKHEQFEQSRSYPSSEQPIFQTNIQQVLLNNEANLEKRKEYWNKKKSYFACATGANLINSNLIITQELDKLLKIYQQEKDIGRSIAYRKALSIIRTLPFEITSKDQIKNIPGIGTKIKGKIQEIVRTGNCQKAQVLSTDERNKVIEMLSAVWGIGPSTAASLYQNGIRSIQQLRENKQMLNRNQEIGLRYYEDIIQRMPRDEATEIVEKVKQALKEFYSPDDFSKLEVTACGSYRRGKETCGDVDILLSWKDGQETKPKGLMTNLLKQLTDQDFLKENLAMPHVNSYGMEQYMGICKVRTLHRRIDIKYYPIELYGYALLYFTGSDYFNRSMRLFARKKGYSLSDHGLFRVTRLAKNNKITSPFSIPCYNEQAVFSALELEYKTPEQRNV